MKSTKRLTTFDEVSREINLLCDAVNKAQNAEGRSSEGKPGDFRVVFDDNRQSYLEAYGKNGWVTTFTGALYDRPMHGRPNPHFPYLEVDNLFAKTYTVAQTTARIGNEVMSSAFGIVESFSNNTITFKDQSNQNLCSFAVNDTCEVRHIKADKSLDIKKINFTVTAVSGRTVTVTYAVGSSLVSVGDIVVQKGNTTNATRQKAIYFSTADNTNVPYIDLYAGTTGYTFGTPKASFGDMTHIADADFNSVAPYLLSGDGIYCTNAYIKGKILMTNQGSISISGFNNDAGFITRADAGNKTTYGTTAPSTPATGDFWYDTSVTNKYIMKRWSGSAWQVVSVYADASGLYADNITAGQITAGTLTGFTIQTAANGARVVISGSSNDLSVYATDGSLAGTLSGTSGAGVMILRTPASSFTYSTFASDQVSVNQVNVGYGSLNAQQLIFVDTLSQVRLSLTRDGMTYKNESNLVKFTLDNTGAVACQSLTIGGGAAATQSWVSSQGFITSESDPTVYAWAKAASKPSYTYSEVGAEQANANIQTHIGTTGTPHVTALEKSNWDSKQPALSGTGIVVTAAGGPVSYITDSSANWNTAYTIANGLYAWAKAATKPSYTYSEVGAAASSHTHTLSQISNVASTTITYKDGTGTNQTITVVVPI